MQKETQQKAPLTNDLLLTNLDAIGSTKRSEKLMIKGDILCVDNRRMQPIARWWTSDNRTDVAQRVLSLISLIETRVGIILKACDPDKRLVTKYLVSLHHCKKGVRNLHQTYDDNHTHALLNLVIQKIEDIIYTINNA